MKIRLAARQPRYYHSNSSGVAGNKKTVPETSVPRVSCRPVQVCRTMGNRMYTSKNRREPRFYCTKPPLGEQSGGRRYCGLALGELALSIPVVRRDSHRDNNARLVRWGLIKAAWSSDKVILPAGSRSIDNRRTVNAVDGACTEALRIDLRFSFDFH